MAQQVVAAASSSTRCLTVDSPPSTDNDGKPIDKGDIWLDTNTGWLWVYDGNVWLPVGDRPPVIISPNPPNYNGASDGNIQYPDPRKVISGSTPTSLRFTSLQKTNLVTCAG